MQFIYDVQFKFKNKLYIYVQYTRKKITNYGSNKLSIHTEYTDYRHMIVGTFPHVEIVLKTQTVMLLHSFFN